MESLEYKRAIDVAGGDGRVSKECLCGLFPAVDLFDQCPKAINKVKQVRPFFPRLKSVKKKTMQEYVFKNQYNLILMNWCAGYLSNDELILFLLKAQGWLIRGYKKTTRGSRPLSHIVIFDNIADDGEGVQ